MANFISHKSPEQLDVLDISWESFPSIIVGYNHPGLRNILFLQTASNESKHDLAKKRTLHKRIWSPMGHFKPKKSNKAGSKSRSWLWRARYKKAFLLRSEPKSQPGTIQLFQKANDRSWKNVYVVIRSNRMFMYKDKKVATEVSYNPHWLDLWSWNCHAIWLHCCCSLLSFFLSFIHSESSINGRDPRALGRKLRGCGGWLHQTEERVPHQD